MKNQLPSAYTGGSSGLSQLVYGEFSYLSLFFISSIDSTRFLCLRQEWKHVSGSLGNTNLRTQKI